jgi:hypothetical protein
MYRSISPAARLILISLAVCTAASGCAAETGAEGSEERTEETGATSNLELGVPQDGFQIETLATMIEAGDDAEWCEVIQLPGTSDQTYFVGRIESAMTPYAHYLTVSAAIPGSDTEANMEAGTRVNCQRAGEVFGEELVEIATSQRPYEDVRYQEGVGKLLYGGQKVVIDYQYFNTSDEPVPAKVKINVHLAEKGEIKKIARLATFNNLTIYTPPLGESSHLGECLISQDALVSTLSRHTHLSGTNFRVWYAGGKRDGELVWSSSSQDKEAAYQLPGGPVLLNAGEGFRFQCDYRNDTAEPLQFGIKVNDEACILQATWWVANPEEEAEEQDCILLAVDEDGFARK